MSRFAKNCLDCNKQFFKPINRSHKSWKIAKFCSVKCKNRSKRFGEIMSGATKGIPKSEEHRKKAILNLNIGVPWNKGKKLPHLSGEKCHLWKGGITPLNGRIRKSLEYKLWRRTVFERDNWTCIWCGARSGKGTKVILHADHIKPFVYFPELRFAIDNGRTLCIDCHKKTDTYGSKMRKFKALQA